MPSAAPPSWLSDALATCARALRDIDAHRERLAGQAEAVSALEASAVQNGERIGHALDQLARDHSAVATIIEKIEGQLPGAQLAQERAADEIDVCSSAASAPGAYASAPLELAAAAFAGTRRALRLLRAELAESLRLQEDLAFQIQQLKGRLASFDASVQLDKDALHAAMSEVGRSLQETIALLMAEMERIGAHLEAFPELAIELGSRST
jgi:chromosome segregation ATPase